MRRRLIGCVALTLALVACSEGTIDCSPCGGSRVDIYVTSLKAGSTGVRACVAGRCDRLVPLREAWPTVPVHDDLTEAKLVELQVYRGTKLTDRYTASFALRPPSGKNCDCGEFRLLTPGPDGTLVQCSLADEIGCTSRDQPR